MSAIPKNLKAVIFDLDGTLIDTAQEFVVVVQQLRGEQLMVNVFFQIVFLRSNYTDESNFYIRILNVALD